MTPPDTKLDKQKKRHRVPLWGMAVLVVLVALMFFGYLTYLADTDEPEDPPTAEEALPEGEGIPGEGAPVTPLDDPDGAPQVIEEAPTPAED